MRLVAVVLAALFSSAAASGGGGRLCVAGNPCVDGVRLPAAVAPGAERTFTWTDAENARLVVGTVPAGAERAEASATVDVKLRLRSKDPQRWPAPATLVLRGASGREWRVELSAREVRREWSLALPDGRFDIVVDSPRHLRSVRHLDRSSAKVDLALDPLPEIRGRVIDAKTAVPVAGAVVMVGERNAAVSNVGGDFELDGDPDAWPSSLRITAGGYGTAVVAVPHARATTNLLEIPLSAAAALRVRFDRSKARDAAVAISLFKRNAGTPEPDAVASATLAPGVEEATIASLSPGDYLLVARGGGAGERLGKRLALTSGANAVEIEPKIIHLTIRAEFNGNPLSNARLRISNNDGLWNADWQTDDRGEFRTILWQGGSVSATVRHRETLTMPYIERKTIAELDEVEWHLAIPDREIVGSVIDASTGKPVAKANVAWRVAGPPPYSATLVADAEGRFRLTAAPAGEHVILAAADGYLPGKTATTLLESDRQRVVTVTLQPASETTVRVVDRFGRPAAEAAVLDFNGFTITGQRMTDAAGEVSIPIAEGETRILFAIPRDGSFAVARMVGGGERPMIVNVPEGTANVIVRAQTSGETPIPDLWLLVRYNGILLPFEVQQMLASLQGVNVRTDAAGRIAMRHMPPGLYEMWPAGSAAEVRAIAMNVGGEAPVKIDAAAGDVAAVLTFEPAKKK